LLKNDKREQVQKEIKRIFSHIKGLLAQQPTNFPIPRCGGREKTTESKFQHHEEIDKTETAYMISLEAMAIANNPQDAGPTEPPKRPRKFTISYANAAKSGILKNYTQDHTIDKSTADTTTQTSNESSTQRQVSWDESTQDTGRSPGSSLSRSMTNSKIQNLRKDLDAEIKEIKYSLESRMQKQEEQMSEVIQVIKTMNENIEQRMAHAVITALVKEKKKVEELTHGRTSDITEAPLADAEGNLPFGGKVQSGGPLHRLHHVEITLQQMSTALDAILSHMQKDPTAQYLFKDEDDESETVTILETDPVQTRTASGEVQQFIDNDVPMTTIKEYSGTKRLHSTDRSPTKHRYEPDPEAQSSPQRTPPPKREKPEQTKPPAKPDGIARERGQS
jgi:hypothetical protein